MNAATQEAVIYTRVSSAGQAAEGISLDAQRAWAEERAKAEGWRVVGTFSDEGISGRKANRPGLRDAMNLVCERPGRVLIVYSLSRLARSVPDAYTSIDRLQKRGYHLVSLTEQINTSNAMGRAFIGFLAVLAQLEADLTGERTAAALHEKRRRGEKTGGVVPFGFRLAEDRKTLIPDDGDRATLTQMREWRRDGFSWPAIADELNRRNVPTKSGRPWSAYAARHAGINGHRMATGAA